MNEAPHLRGAQGGARVGTGVNQHEHHNNLRPSRLVPRLEVGLRWIELKRARAQYIAHRDDLSERHACRRAEAYEHAFAIMLDAEATR